MPFYKIAIASDRPSIQSVRYAISSKTIGRNQIKLVCELLTYMWGVQ